MSRNGLHLDGLCDQCISHNRSLPKYSEVRQRLQLALNETGITIHTAEIPRITAATKLVETFVRESGIRIQIPFYPALALQNLAVRTCHPL